MKTNVVMLSNTDRNLFGVTIRQNTEGSMLSLTDLQEAYVHARVVNGWVDKDISNILNYEENIERMFYILKEQKLFTDDKTTLTWFYETVKNDGVVKTLKRIGVYKTTGRGENKQTVCNPYIWVLVAMELNPMLYAKVVTWLTDKLIINRIEAGNLYKDLAAACYKLPDVNYPCLAKWLNTKIFGKHEIGIRNKGSETELNNLKKLEYGIAFGINNGWINGMDDIKKAIDNYNVI